MYVAVYYLLYSFSVGYYIFSQLVYQILCFSLCSQCKDSHKWERSNDVSCDEDDEEEGCDEEERVDNS